MTNDMLLDFLKIQPKIEHDGKLTLSSDNGLLLIQCDWRIGRETFTYQHKVEPFNLMGNRGDVNTTCEFIERANDSVRRVLRETSLKRVECKGVGDNDGFFHR